MRLKPSIRFAARTALALERFSADRLLLTSECGFQHVPLDITRAKLRALTAGAVYVRNREAQPSQGAAALNR
jgi:methionine synthase II (cobalamin-independent)